MGANKDSDMQKCGEILINIKTKNRKNKIYIFHCAFCDLYCDQLKKFSVHIGKHLNHLDDNLNETEVKFEPEEIKVKIHAETGKNNFRKVFRRRELTCINKDPLDILNSVTSPLTTDIELSIEVKTESKQDSNIEYTNCDRNELACRGLEIDIAKQNNEKSNEIDIFDIVDDIRSEDGKEIKKEYINEKPLKKRKRNIKKKHQLKVEQVTSDTSSDDSKDADYNVKKESNIRKKHKRCKKRWKSIDESKLPVLIDMYKKYEVLWKVNDIAFGILPKKNEVFGKMIEELKSNHNFDKNLDELQDHIDYINYIFYKDREQELKCELDKVDFIPSSKFYNELSFLSESQGPFKCSNCNEIIGKYDRYHIHVAQHNGAIPFQCRLCEMGFQKFDNYLRHVTRHLGINRYHCNVCGKGYPFKSELDWHLTSHTGVKPYLCQICGAGFRARHGYDNHIRRHEKRFRYECHICKHGFNHLCKLNTHIKSHLNIRDVICNVCGKGFTAAKYLQRHKLIHEEEKRYKCNVCGKAFAQDSGLRTHRKQHQPYAMITENKNLLNVLI